MHVLGIYFNSHYCFQHDWMKRNVFRIGFGLMIWRPYLHRSGVYHQICWWMDSSSFSIWAKDHQTWKIHAFQFHINPIWKTIKFWWFFGQSKGNPFLDLKWWCLKPFMHPKAIATSNKRRPWCMFWGSTSIVIIVFNMIGWNEMSSGLVLD